MTTQQMTMQQQIEPAPAPPAAKMTTLAPRDFLVLPSLVLLQAVGQLPPQSTPCSSPFWTPLPQEDRAPGMKVQLTGEGGGGDRGGRG
jgi:hypothetical protein